MMKQKINVAIVDDHSLFRKGLKNLFQSTANFVVSFDASGGQELFQQLNHHTPDVILLDLKMPGMNGMECLRILKGKYPEIRVLILSMFDDNPFVFKSFKLGARGYLLKNAEPDELFHAVTRVYEQEYFFTDHLASTMINGLSEKEQASMSVSGLVPFNSMEKEILKYICQGMTNQEIAQILFRSLRTIEGYRLKLLKKTYSKNTAALVAWAFRNGLIH